jgi:hypothetical protein
MGVGHCILPNSFALRLAQMAEHFFATDQPDTAWGMGPPAAVLAGDNGGEGNDASRQIVDCLAGVKNDFNDDYCVDDARPCAGLGQCFGVRLIGRGGKGIRPKDLGVCAWPSPRM